MSMDATEKLSPAIQITSEPDRGRTQPPSTRVAKAEQRRKQVLDAARVVFRDQGFHGASMAEIAAEAAMSVGHIYRYFDNKEAVIIAIVERDLQLAKETIDRMLQDPAGVPAAMVAGVDEGVAKMLDRQDAALFMEVMAEAARNPRVAHSARQQHESAQDCLALLFKGEKVEGATVGDGSFTSAQAVDLLTLVFSGLRVRAIQDPTADAAMLAATIKNFVSLLTK